MPPHYKFADLFCGAGGFSKGFENTGRFEAGFAVDINKDCVKTFSENHAKAFVKCIDIRKIKDKDIKELAEKCGPFDVIIGGPPCGGFSSIRPFRSIKDGDPKNNLYEEFGRFLKLLRPKVFAMENVVGLLTHKRGKSFQAIISGLRGLGYNVVYRVLNAVHYGVPQRRERLIIMGSTKGKITFPKPTHFYKNDKSMAKREVRFVVREPSQKPLFGRDESNSYKLSPALTVIDAIGDLPSVKSGEEDNFYKDDYKTNFYQKARRKGQTTLTLHKATDHTARMLKIIKKAGNNRSVLPEGMTTSGFSTTYSRLEPYEPAVTLTVNFVHPASNKCIHPFQDRALTPREGARLQSFDDDFVFYGNRTSIIRQIGNAVPPLLGEAIGIEVAKFLDGLQ